MVALTKPPAAGFVRMARKVYNPVGFSKGYNFVLWFIFSGALMGFCLARMPQLDWNTRCPAGNRSADCYSQTKYSTAGVGFKLHLIGILPSGILACVQFTPVIRHKFLLLHRINGYVTIVLAIMSVVGAFMVGRNSFGGGMDILFGIGVVGILFPVCLLMAWINIKRLQIEQHRAWMLRAWFYASFVITARLIRYILVPIVTAGGYATAARCENIQYMWGGSRSRTLAFYPDCAPYFSGANLDKNAVIKPEDVGAVGIQASVYLTFGAAAWLALVLHAVGVELYLRLTPAEAERLRQVSYQRQVEAGMKDPGRGGFPADRLGDAPKWEPPAAASSAPFEAPCADS